MNTYNATPVAKSDRIKRLVEHLYAKMPEIEAARAELITESYQATEGQPVIIRKARAFEHILKHLPIIIRPEELIVGSTTIAPRGCQTYPEFSYDWLHLFLLRSVRQQLSSGTENNLQTLLHFLHHGIYLNRLT